MNPGRSALGGGASDTAAPGAAAAGAGVQKQGQLGDLDGATEAVVMLPPDGGWGWVVVACAFLTNLVADGTAYAFGIFTGDIAHSMAAPVTHVAIASSVMTGSYYLTGPFSCALINRYGFRPVAFMGGLVAAAALGLSSTLRSLLGFVLCFGTLCGLGFSMLYVPSIMVVGFYFERWRPLATSLTVCGSSAGMVLFPPVFKLLLDDLSWRFKFRVLCGLCLCCAMLTLTYRPISALRVTVPGDKKRAASGMQYVGGAAKQEACQSCSVSGQSSRSSVTTGGGSVVAEDASSNVVTFFRRFHNMSYASVGDAMVEGGAIGDDSRATGMGMEEEGVVSSRDGRGGEVACFATPSRSSTVSFLLRDVSLGSVSSGGGRMDPTRGQSKSLLEGGERLSPLLEEDNEGEGGGASWWRGAGCGCCAGGTMGGPGCRWRSERRKNEGRGAGTAVAGRPMYRDDVFYTGSIYALSDQWAGGKMSRMSSGPSKLNKRSAMLDYHISVTRVTTQKDLEEDARRCVWCPVAVRRTLATMLEVGLLKSPAFNLILVSGFFTTLGMYTPFIYIGQYAVAKHMSRHLAVYLISALGISNCVGRLACGVVSSFPGVGALRFSCLSLVVCGGVTVASVFLYDVRAQFAYAALFGLTIAALPSLRSIILVEMFGLERLTNAFGLAMLFQGVACLAGLPISGALIDLTGTYDASFLFAGSAIAFSGLLLCPVRCLADRERRRAARRREEATYANRAAKRARAQSQTQPPPPPPPPPPPV